MKDDEFKDTVRIQLTRKVGTDQRGRTVWTKPVEPIELELVSTDMLQKMLASDDEERKERIRSVATNREGVLARHTNSSEFEILGEDELRKALKAADGESSPNKTTDVVYDLVDDSATAGELSLVTTQMLRRVLRKDETEDKDRGGKKDEVGGFNPYDKS